MTINKERLVQQFLDLTKIDSESFHEHKMAEYLKKVMHDLGIEMQEDDSAEKTGSDSGNLYGYFPSLTPEEYDTVLFSGHMDTVKPGNGRKAIVHANGKITSDGTTVLGADDGVALACIIEAIREIQEENLPHRNIEILFATAEEAYTIGASAFDFTKFKAKKAYIPDDSDVIGCYSVHEPTLISFQITVRGKAAHAGFDPEKGINSLAAAASAIARIPQGRLDDHTTFNIGLIEGGTATNAVPEETIVRGELRSTVHERALSLYDDTLQIFREEAEKIGAAVEGEKIVHLTAYHVPEDSAALADYKEVLDGLGIPLHAYPSFGGSDINVLRRNGIDGLCIGNSMYNCHTTKEYALTDEMVQLAEIIRNLMILKV